MSSLEIKLTDSVKKYLEAIKLNEYSKFKPKSILKATVILLRHNKKSLSVIAKETGLSRRSVINYLSSYKKDGNKFIIGRGNYRKSALSKETKLFEEFENNPPQSYKEATERIKNIYNIALSESAVRRHLNKIGIYTSTKRKK